MLKHMREDSFGKEIFNFTILTQPQTKNGNLLVYFTADNVWWSTALPTSEYSYYLATRYAIGIV